MSDETGTRRAAERTCLAQVRSGPDCPSAGPRERKPRPSHEQQKSAGERPPQPPQEQAS